MNFEVPSCTDLPTGIGHSLRELLRSTGVIRYVTPSDPLDNNELSSLVRIYGRDDFEQERIRVGMDFPDEVFETRKKVMDDRMLTAKMYGDGAVEFEREYRDDKMIADIDDLVRRTGSNISKVQ